MKNSSDPELILDISRIGSSKADRLEALQALYATHYPAIKEAERALEYAHEGYVGILLPVSQELMGRVRGSQLFLGNEFQDAFCLRSDWLRKEMRTIRQAYERQYGAACGLINML